MKYTIANEPNEQLDLDVQDGRFNLIQRLKEMGDNWRVKVIIMNKREALKLHQAIQQEVLNKK